MKIYFKKSSLALALSAATSLAFADASPYIGGGLGLDVNTAQKAAPGNFRGIPFELIAGYGGILSQYAYLGGEAYGTFATAGVSGTNTLRTNYNYGANLIPGYMLTERTMAFGKIGVVRARFSNLNSYETGGKFGLGLQTCLTQNLDVRGGYDYTTYGTLHGSISSGVQTDGFHVAFLYKLD